MGYVMETREEFERLEQQAKMSHYRLEDELAGVLIRPGTRILDAGCGSGVASRFMLEHYPGVEIEACDLSEIRLQQAKNQVTLQNQGVIRFFKSSLEEIESENSRYDFVFCRFVLEHLPNPEIAVSEFYRVLRPGGVVYLVDLDGILFNLSHQNARLSEQLLRIQQGLNQDLFVGRRMPALVHQAGFSGTSWRAMVMDFRDATLNDEFELTRQRLLFARPEFARILGSEAEADEFRRMYCEEILKPGNVLFYNKFIVSGTKP
jgi:ubiquinone/menaquinone biosynthesis C-methylase UbiE